MVEEGRGLVAGEGAVQAVKGVGRGWVGAEVVVLVEAMGAAWVSL